MKSIKNGYSILKKDLHSNVECYSFAPNTLPAFSLIELMVVIAVLAAILALAYGTLFVDRQKEFDAKYSKVASVISSNIDKDIIEKTGFRYQNYADDNITFRNVVVRNLDVDDCFYENCWGAGRNITINNNNYNNFDSMWDWRFYRLKDKTVIAVSANGTEILIDTNGRSGPNVAGKDIRRYNH